MYDTTIATKLLGQLKAFLGRISPHFHKPVARFIGDMIYGIMVEKDVKLASIVRALKEKTTPKKVEDRLSRMLSSEGLETGLHGVIASEGARRVHKDTLIILDPSDVQKPYARKMECLAKVWDGSRGEVGDNLGFWGCMAVACESGGRRPVPQPDFHLTQNENRHFSLCLQGCSRFRARKIGEPPTALRKSCKS